MKFRIARKILFSGRVYSRDQIRRAEHRRVKWLRTRAKSDPAIRILVDTFFPRKTP